jgi:leucyl/phenylalanyl-tRNA--protein transferase
MREAFPPVALALDEPNGLLAAGGDLSIPRLLDAYGHGIFPWYSADEPILWWSPDPRMVFATDRVHVAAKLRRWLRNCDWTITADQDFTAVMHACAAPRPKQPTTWISPAILEAYTRLHHAGHAHSIEVRDGADLVGGIYGVSIGRMFFGESMFSSRTNGSKAALLALCRVLHEWGFPLLDAQVASAHLVTLGAFELPRKRFVTHLNDYCERPFAAGNWRERWPLRHARGLVV